MSSSSALPSDDKPSSSRSMIVYDREGELFWRKKGWFGSHSWKKYYAVLSCLRRCIYLFSEYYLYERHLLEINGYENEFQAWSECIPLHTASIYVANTYFTRPHTFEICSPSGIYYMSAESESAVRGWLASLSLAGVSMKSDEKCLLVWRSVSEETCEAGDCFYYCRALSSMPPHERPTLQGWNSTASNVQTLVKKLAVKVAQFTRDEIPTPRLSTSSNSASHSIPISLDGFDVDFTPDLSYGKHGFMSKLSRSLFARLYSNKHASSDPSSPFFDPQAALEKQSASAVSSPYTRWVRRFYRTMESAAGKPVLVWYGDRDDLHHNQPRNHIIPLSRARVFDLYSIRRRVEAAVAEDEEMAQRQRWKRMQEAEAINSNGAEGKEKTQRNSNLSISPNEDSESESDEEEGGQPLSKRAKKAAFRARVNRCYLASPLFPEPLPNFAPYSQEDLALYVLDPSPRYIFLRADTPREKVKWVSVLRNLAGEVWNDRNQATASASTTIPQFLPTDPSKRSLVTPAASSVPVGVPLSNQLMDILPKKERKHIVAADGLDAIYNPRLAKKKTALALDELLEADLDEREIHVCRRDFYAILGVSCTANTELITHRYSLLHKDLLSKLIPKSPLHRIMPLPTTEEIQEATASFDQRSMNFAPTSVVTASGASMQPNGENSIAQPKGHKKARTFVFDQAELDQLPTTSDGSSINHDPASGAASSSVASTPLTAFEIEKKLQRQISELREIWRILKDPVRRTQYDERRCILRLDELKNRPLGQHANATVDARQMFEEERYHEMKMQHHLQQPPKYDALLVKQEEHENPIHDVTLMSQDFSPSALVAKVDLDALLVRAAKSAQSLPRSSTAIHPPNVLPIRTNRDQRLAATAADKEELYESKYNEVYESKQGDLPPSVSFAQRLEAAASSSSSIPLGIVLTGAVSANEEDHKHTAFVQPSPKSRGRRSPSPLTDSAFHLATIPSNVHASASTPATTTTTPSPTSISLLNLAPLEIASPNSQTLWMLGDEVEIRWNPLLSEPDAASSSDASHFTHKPRSASVVFDPLHRVRLDLMRHRQLVKDTLMCQIARECFNNGVCKFRIPSTLPPRSDYYVKLTLSYADAVDGNFSPPINQSTSRSQLFCIQPFSKQERYVEGLESALSPPNGINHLGDMVNDDEIERKPSPPPQWKKSKGNNKDKAAAPIPTTNGKHSNDQTTSIVKPTTSTFSSDPPASPAPLQQSALPGLISSPTR